MKKRRAYDDFAAKASDGAEGDAVCMSGNQLEVVRELEVEDCEEANQSDTDEKHKGKQHVQKHHAWIHLNYLKVLKGMGVQLPDTLEYTLV